MKKYLPLIIFAFIFAFNVCESYASDEAKFSLVANTPTNITVPVNRNAYVQYQVTNNTTITRKLTMVAIPNVVQVTLDRSQCSNPFVLSPGQSCKLTLYIDGQQISKFSGGPIVCKTKGATNQPDPLLCSQPSSSMILSVKSGPAINNPDNKLYVSNWSGNSISLCYIQSGNLTQCLVSAVSNTFANPEALAINGNVLFVANIGGGISSCAINGTTGGLFNCINAASTTDPIYAPDGISIQTTGSGTYAYIANSGPEQFHQGVTVCNVSGQLLSNCTFTQGNASFSIPSDLAINDNTLYITNFNSNTIQTTYCTIPGSPSSICSSGEGVISGTSNLLNEPEGLFFANINAVNYAYFTNHGNNTVTVCQVTSPTNFSGCFITQGYFTGFGNLAILSNPLKAFIPSGLKSIAICDVHSDGSLSNCANSTELNFNNPSGLIIQ